ncbi:Pfs, NACHT and ankyrin domain protein [Aureobasidium pullulans]|uniref:Pfs, NACHT and ankyrin domain protein n=1 Tax=Aureobasidium pullulans TaxID=5580 RepID=A0A4S9K008_AURPU|nr:Pfs, NACHT and ankyrin domain protein [Aureobasidium pullulans]
MSTEPLLRQEDFTVGWICALPTEMAAACAMLDEEYDMLNTQHPADHNSYQLGRIGHHKVVITCLPEYGTNPAATVAKDMLRTFESIKVGVVVGIGAAIPSEHNEIRLGDVVVSSSEGTHGGVVQWDRGKTRDGVFERSLNKPPTVLRTALANMRSHHLRKGDNIVDTIRIALQQNSRLRKNKFFFQGSEHDTLDRTNRDDDDPIIHYGIIASGNQVIKDEQERDRLRDDLGAICIEMEAAGLMDSFPCLIIRGICDYADFRKTKQWQPYAAMTAAACAKELLSFVHNQSLGPTPNIIQVLNPIAEQVADLHLLQRQDQIEEWLSPPDPSESHRIAIEKHQRNTGAWFLGSDVFAFWEAGAAHSLWLHGIPGCGKTVLSSTIIQHLRQRPGTVTIFFYFDCRDPQKRTANGMLRSLTNQLYTEQKNSRPPLDELQDRRRELTSDLLLATLFQMINLVIPTVQIVLDALEECQERSELLKYISRLCDLSHANIQVIMTSRRETDIESSINRWMAKINHVTIQHKYVNEDIRTYVHEKIRNDERFERWQQYPEVLREIECGILERAEGMWVMYLPTVSVSADKN